MSFLRTCLVVILVSLPHGALAQTVSATSLGVVPNDGKPDSASIQAALYEAQARGDTTLFLPSGEYEIEAPIEAVSGIAIAGAGCGRTVLRRSQESRGQIMFVLNNVADATFRNLSFEYDGAPQFYRAIGFRALGSRGIFVQNNCFNDDRPIEARGDRWAIELSATQSSSSDIIISDNTVSGAMQLTAGGGAGLSRVLISSNKIDEAQSNAIAISTLSDEGVFQHIHILRNTITNPSQIGVFIGPDQPYAEGGRFADIQISYNYIEGVRSRYGYGIFVRASAHGTTGITISHNTLEANNAEKKSGIRLTDDHDIGRRTISEILICDNRTSNFSRGIWLENVTKSTIARNKTSSARPIIYSNALQNHLIFDEKAKC